MLTKVGTASIMITLECRKRPPKQDVTWVEQLGAKKTAIRLKRAKLSASSRRGYWQLTEAGQLFARDHPGPLSPDVSESLATDHSDVRLRPFSGDESLATAPSQPPPADRATVNPDDRLEQALSELRENVVAELLDTLSHVSPEYFELEKWYERFGR